MGPLLSVPSSYPLRTVFIFSIHTFHPFTYRRLTTLSIHISHPYSSLSSHLYQLLSLLLDTSSSSSQLVNFILTHLVIINFILYTFVIINLINFILIILPIPSSSYYHLGNLITYRTNTPRHFIIWSTRDLSLSILLIVSSFCQLVTCPYQYSSSSHHFVNS